MRSILILVAFVVGMLCNSYASAQSLNASWVAGENAFEQECVNGVCALKKQAPAASHSLPVPIVVERPVSQQPTPAAAQAVTQPAAEAKPMRSVLVKPVRGAFCAVSKVRQAKPVRRILGRLFCR